MSSASLRVRKLPDGTWYAGTSLDRTVDLLHFSLAAEGAPADLDIGSLLEVEEKGRIYLGETRDRQGQVLTIHVEHILDRDQLAEIHLLWQSGKE